MALHDTQVKQEQQAVKDLVIKLSLERQMIIKLRKYFTTIADRFQNFYADTGIILDTTQFNEQLNQMMFEQYKNTSDKFKNQLLNHGDVSKEIKDDQELLDRIDTGIQHYSVFSIQKSVTSIDKTNQNQVNKSVRNVLIASAITGLVLSRKQIAQRAGISFKANAFARTNTIAMTETQKAAEGTKSIESHNLNSKKKDKEKPMLKTWVAVLDEKTRGSHAAADGQTVIVTDPFIVQGENLMFPGDSDLGASAGNTINCRCASISHAEGENVE